MNNKETPTTADLLSGTIKVQYQGEEYTIAVWELIERYIYDSKDEI